MLSHILPPQIKLSEGFALKLQNCTFAILNFRRIKKINLTMKLQILQNITKPALIVRIHWDFILTAVHVLLPKYPHPQNFGSTQVIESSFLLHGRPNILLVNLQQPQMSVRALRHDSPSGRLSRGLSARVSFLSSPPLPAPFLVPSSFFAPKPLGNTCYAGYETAYIFTRIGFSSKRLRPHESE